MALIRFRPLLTKCSGRWSLLGPPSFTSPCKIFFIAFPFAFSSWPDQCFQSTFWSFAWNFYDEQVWMSIGITWFQTSVSISHHCGAGSIIFKMCLLSFFVLRRAGDATSMWCSPPTPALVSRSWTIRWDINLFQACDEHKVKSIKDV